MTNQAPRGHEPEKPIYRCEHCDRPFTQEDVDEYICHRYDIGTETVYMCEFCDSQSSVNPDGSLGRRHEGR